MAKKPDSRSWDLDFAFDKSTKGTHVFREVDEDGAEPKSVVIGTLYVKKTELGEKAPKRLRVRVSVKDSREHSL